MTGTLSSPLTSLLPEGTSSVVRFESSKQLEFMVFVNFSIKSSLVCVLSGLSEFIVSLLMIVFERV